MTFPRFRGRQVRFDGDFPDDGQAVTEVINAIKPAAWDGTTITFGGASVVGLDPAQVYGAPVADEASGVRQAIEQTGLAERRRAATGPHPRLRAVPDAPRPPQAAPPPLAGWAAIARELTDGWPHLFEVRCQFPAAASATPIPCGAVHRDPAALTFRALRASAFAAGWHLDAFGRFACPRCCQDNPGFQTLYPVVIWDRNAVTARLAENYRAEFEYRAEAEYELFRDVRDSARRGRHAGGAR